MKKLTSLVIASAVCCVGVKAQPFMNQAGSYFAGGVSFGAPVLVTNTLPDPIVPRLSVINPLVITGTVSTVIFKDLVSTNTGLSVSNTFTLSNTAISVTNILRTLLTSRGVTNPAGWSLGMISKPPDNLENSWPWNLGLSDKELIAYRTNSSKVIIAIQEGLNAEGFSVAFDLPTESFQRGRISYNGYGQLVDFASTNSTGVYVSLPPVVVRSNFTTPAFQNLEAIVIFTNLQRTTSVRVPEVSWWGTNNWTVPWLGSVGASSAGNLRGF